MHLRTKFVIILLFLLFLNISIVSAEDSNATDISQMNDNETLELDNTIEQNTLEDNGIEETILKGNATDNESSEIEKTTPTVTISSKKVYSKDSLEICLMNSTGSPLKSKTLKINLNNKVYSLVTNSKGVAKLPINLNANTYKLTISFNGDDNYSSISKSFKIKVIKLKTKLVQSANFVVKGNYLYFYLVDSNGYKVSGKKVTIKFNGKKYTKKTNSAGRVKLKIKLKYSKYTLRLNLKGISNTNPLLKNLNYMLQLPD